MDGATWCYSYGGEINQEIEAALFADKQWQAGTKQMVGRKFLNLIGHIMEGGIAISYVGRRNVPRNRYFPCWVYSTPERPVAETFFRASSEGVIAQ